MQFSLLGIHPKALMEQQQKDDQNRHEFESDSDSDLDYNDEGDENKMDSDDDLLDDFFLSDNTQTYGEPPMATFSKDLMTTGTRVIKWLPLGAICQQKATIITNISCQKD